MTYVTIKEETEERLHLNREPSSRAWAILLGILSIGIGAAYYSVDYMLWKMAYFSGAVFLGLSCMEDWEECVLDKKTGKIEVKRQSLIQKLFQASKGQKIVVADMNDAVSVNVEEEDVKYGAKGYIVVMNFASGYSLGVTETAIIGDRSEPEFIAEKIHNFLQLDGKADPGSAATTPGSELIEDGENGSTTSDDSFEQIDKAELYKDISEQGDTGGENIDIKEQPDLLSEELEKQD